MTRIMLLPALCRSGNNSATDRGVCDGDVVSVRVYTCTFDVCINNKRY
jgi:hypothetical protein